MTAAQAYVDDSRRLDDLQEPRGDTVIGECRFRVSPEMITEWGGFETVTCGDVSNLLFRFDMDRKRLL